jgi:hypothetical protein
VRDARSDSYTRVDGLAIASAGPVSVVRARLSKIERGPEGLLIVRSRMLSRAGGQMVPAASSTDVALLVRSSGQSALASAQQNPVSSRATATATIVRRLPR